MNPRFDRSRKNLAAALNQLESAVKEKIREASLLAVGDVGEDEVDAKIIEQNAVITKLSGEVNRLQNQLSELGKENEFLTQNNKTLWQRIENFTQQKNDLVAAIEVDLAIIHEVIEKYDG